MKKVLVIGGTRFFGRKLVELLIADGHDVTIVTRGQLANPFGDKVKHLIVNRRDTEAFSTAVEGEYYDIVYDNICYSQNEAKAFCDIFNGKVDKLVFTSTIATYAADGKAQCEAVFFKYATCPVVAVRFPIVMGVDDYTERLHFHVKHIVNKEVIGFVNMDAEMSFILAQEAGQFLKWAGLTNVEGPFNATAQGTISLQALIMLVEKATGNQAKIVLVENDEIRSPYAVPASWYMTAEKAQQAGFVFSKLNDWLPGLIWEIAKQSN